MLIPCNFYAYLIFSPSNYLNKQTPEKTFDLLKPTFNCDIQKLRSTINELYGSHSLSEQFLK